MPDMPNLEQLREARAWWDDAPEDATYIPEYVPEYDDAISDALDWLLSLADSGGRLVVETPCGHGVFNPHWCGGSSRKVVWPEEEGER